jgi:hypothetical protein
MMDGQLKPPKLHWLELNLKGCFPLIDSPDDTFTHLVRHMGGQIFKGGACLDGSLPNGAGFNIGQGNLG